MWGVTVQDPLVDRQENISMLLSIESEIFGLILREEETRNLQEIYSQKLSQLPEKQLEFSNFGEGLVEINMVMNALNQTKKESDEKKSSRS